MTIYHDPKTKKQVEANNIKEAKKAMKPKPKPKLKKKAEEPKDD